SRLKSNDAAQREISVPAAVRSGQRKVGNKAVTQVLVGVAALHVVIELIHWKIHEGGEVSIVDGVRVGVVGIQRQILSNPLQAGDREAVVRSVGYVVVVIDKACADGLEPGQQCAGKIRT